MNSRTRYVVAFYEADRSYGGSEEGGWWYDCGDLLRVVRVYKTRDAASRAANRANRKFEHQRKFRKELWGWRNCPREIGSVLYSGGHYEAHVCEDYAPQHYPEHRPVYE